MNKNLKAYKTMTIVVAALLCLAFSQTALAVAGPVTWELFAGQDNDVGSLSVTNTGDSLEVTYTLDASAEATFGTLQVGVYTDTVLFPFPGGNTNNRPTPGHYPYHYNVPGGTISKDDGRTQGLQVISGSDNDGNVTYTFVIPAADINSVDVAPYCGQPLFILAHAEVNYNAGGEDTAFGGDTGINLGGGGGAWYYYGTYEWFCDVEPPPGFCYTETAFAYGTHVFSSHKRGNPDDLDDSLRLSKGRWGWASIIEDSTSVTIYAGAGLNDTSKGEAVGQLDVSYDGTTVTATYQLDGAYVLEEVHVYASDAPPTTVAPGQYGYPTDGYDVGGVQSVVVTADVEDVDSDGIWFIGHAVVSNGQCD